MISDTERSIDMSVEFEIMKMFIKLTLSIGFSFIIATLILPFLS